MDRKKYCAANWKMNKTPHDSVEYILEFQKKALDNHKVQIVICPPAVSLTAMISEIHRNTIELGGQNMHFENNGAFTGEISADMLVSSGAKWVILGHSERRHVFGESDEMINQKIKQALQSNLKPIFCVGEKIEDRESGNTGQVLAAQLTLGLKDISENDFQNIVIAYEPVWAIGTGLTATSTQVDDAHSVIRELLSKQGYESESTSILYGGSVKSDNAGELNSINGVDGFLIGGAALNVEEYYKIYQSF